MLSKTTKKRIIERKTLKHSNPSQFLKRVRNECNEDIKDLTLIANKLEEKELENIFTEKNLEPLIISILKPKNQRTVEIMEMLANRVFQKLMGELPVDMVNELGSDIGKTWTYAKLAREYGSKKN